jgi:hypothetical protein
MLGVEGGRKSVCADMKRQRQDGREQFRVVKIEHSQYEQPMVPVLSPPY